MQALEISDVWMMEMPGMVDISGINYLHSGQTLSALQSCTVTAKVFQTDVLSNNFRNVLNMNRMFFKPANGLYGMLRVDMPFGLKQHERKYLCHVLYTPDMFGFTCLGLVLHVLASVCMRRMQTAVENDARLHRNAPCPGQCLHAAHANCSREC
jgi:hypothetical protein